MQYCFNLSHRNRALDHERKVVTICRNIDVHAGVFTEEQEPAGSEQQEYFIAANWSRQLGLRTRGLIGASYALEDLADRTDDIYRANVGLSYTFYKTLSATATYNFQKRNSDLSSFEFTENVFTVGVTGTF